MSHADTQNWSLLILAGGQGSRMDGLDKGLMPVFGQPAVAHLLNRFKPASALISANRNHNHYTQLGIPVFADQRTGFHGPLAGLETLLQQAGDVPVVVIPCDMPALPASLPTQMLAQLHSRQTIVVAHDGERLQPLCLALQAKHWLDDLSSYLDGGGRSAYGWLANKPTSICHFNSPKDFHNINDTSALSQWQAQQH